MSAILLLIATMAGGYGLAYAIPQVDIAACEKTAVEVRKMTNLPVDGFQYECISKQEFLKRIGEREA